MKYLYKILRLFFCPHKYIKNIDKREIASSTGRYDTIGGIIIIKECCYCGKLKQFVSTV